jgi:UDP-glucose 4-epimerase
MRRCLVLGGEGFIGTHLCEALAAAGHAVRSFDRPRPGHLAGRTATGPLERVHGDFLNREDVARAIKDCEVVFHLISTTLPKSSNENPVYDVETNVVATLRLLEAARSEGVGKIVFLSSGGTVYGVPRTIPISEAHPTNPICSYGITKLTIEKYLHMFWEIYGLDYAVLRASNPFGEGQHPRRGQGAIAAFAHRAIRGEPVEIWGDGSVTRDYVYVGDVVVALTRAMESGSGQRVFNIGSGDGRTLNEVLAAIEKALGSAVRRSYVAGRSFDVSTSVLDIGLARTHLGWEPRIPFGDGVQRTISWLRSMEHTESWPQAD